MDTIMAVQLRRSIAHPSLSGQTLGVQDRCKAPEWLTVGVWSHENEGDTLRPARARDSLASIQRASIEAF